MGAYLESLGVVVEYKNRKLLGGKELDLYLPEHKVAIEYNGLYWHSDAAHPNAALNHKIKWERAKAQGVQLVQVWEDDWRNRNEQVKSLLAHKIGLAQTGIAYARETSVKQIDKQEAEAFLHANHIQGYASGSSYLALQTTDGATCAVLVLRRRKADIYEIVRYATDRRVPGGFSKLLKHAERTLPIKQVITFSDHMVSDGSLYLKTGFVADGDLKPDYTYVVRGQRQHKFGYRLARFRTDPNLKWQAGLTERELAALNKLPRVWDAGKTRWVKTLGTAS